MEILINPIEVTLEPVPNEVNGIYFRAVDKYGQIQAVFGINRLVLEMKHANTLYSVEMSELIGIEDPLMIFEFLLNKANLTCIGDSPDGIGQRRNPTTVEDVPEILPDDQQADS